MTFDPMTAAEVEAYKPVTGKLVTKAKDRMQAVADLGIRLQWTKQTFSQGTDVYDYQTFPLYVPDWITSGTTTRIVLPCRCQVSGTGGSGSGYTGSFKIGYDATDSNEVLMTTALGTSKNSGFTFTLDILSSALSGNESIDIRLYTKVTTANGTTTVTITHDWVGAGSGYTPEVNADSFMKRVA